MTLMAGSVQNINLVLSNPLSLYANFEEQKQKKKIYQTLSIPDTKRRSYWIRAPSVRPANQSELSLCLVNSHTFTSQHVHRVLDDLKTTHNRFI